MSAEKKDSRQDDVAGQRMPEVSVKIDNIHVHEDGRVCVVGTARATGASIEDLNEAIAGKIDEALGGDGKNKPAMVNSPAFKERYDQINWGRKGKAELN
jgi:hypothetical protein